LKLCNDEIESAENKAKNEAGTERCGLKLMKSDFARLIFKDSR